MTSGGDGQVTPPGQARELFGDAFPVARDYAELLSDAGVERGLIGPREVPRLWDRHLLNCAVVEELIPKGASVVDIGSGAGLPGIVLGILRPDLAVTLLEPLLRRTIFLQEAVDLLALRNVTVRRGRAEELRGDVLADIVTARAVAPLPRLAGWGLPLLKVGGSLLALKGEQADAELVESRAELTKVRPCVADVIRVGSGKVDPATTIVRVTVTSAPKKKRAAAPKERGTSGGQRKRGRKR